MSGPTIMALVSLSLTIGMMVLSALFKVAGKLRLTIPLWYIIIVVISTFFSDFVNEHETLVIVGLWVCVGITVISWIVSLVNAIKRRRQAKFFEEDVAWQIRRARELGIPTTNLQIRSDGTVVNASTGEPIITGKVQFREVDIYEQD